MDRQNKKLFSPPAYRGNWTFVQTPRYKLQQQQQKQQHQQRKNLRACNLSGVRLCMNVYVMQKSCRR